MKSAPGIHVLVLAPTRELATQIQEEAEKFGRGAGYASAVAYGEQTRN
jgi:superfamily II DNA/RNA helicase